MIYTYCLTQTVSVGQRFRSVLAGSSGFWGQGCLSCSCISYVRWSYSHWKAWLGLENELPQRLTSMTHSCGWLLAGGFGSSSYRSLHKALECLHSLVADFLQSKIFKREQGRSHTDPALWGHTCHLHFGHMNQPWFSKESTQGVTTRRRGSLGLAITHIISEITSIVSFWKISNMHKSGENNTLNSHITTILIQKVLRTSHYFTL